MNPRSGSRGIDGISVLDLPDTAAEIDRANLFFARYHDVPAAVPTHDVENAAHERWSGLPRPFTVVAIDDAGEVFGGATAWILTENTDAMIELKGEDFVTRWFQRWRALTYLSVLRSCRGQGIGRALVLRLEDRLREDGARGVWGFAEELPNPSAPFYERLGYTIRGPETMLVGGFSVGQDPDEGRRGMHFVKLLKAPAG